ncbi:MAG: hypothetical protein JXA08_05420 [Methanomicrobiaceae archaeon]|nr:hypothetical protein [Methanomicrobiaceae archaeon]
MHRRHDPSVAAGTHTVSLTVTDACGCETEVKEDYICVTDGPSPVPEFPSLALPAALIIGIVGVVVGLRGMGVRGREGTEKK